MKEHKRRNRSLFQNYLASYVGIAFISCALIGMLLFFFSVHELNIAQYRSTEHKAQLLMDELNNQYRAMQSIVDDVTVDIIFKPTYYRRNKYYEISIVEKLKQYNFWETFIGEPFLVYRDSDSIFHQSGVQTPRTFFRSTLHTEENGQLSVIQAIQTQTVLPLEDSDAFLLLFPVHSLPLRQPYGDIIVCFFVDSLETGGTVGNAFALLSGLSYAGVFLMNDLPDADPICSVFWGDILSAVIGLPFLLRETIFTPTALTSVFILGVFQVGLAYVLMCTGLKTTPAVRAALISGIEPVLNPLLVAFFYRERVGAAALLGAVIVVCSVIWYNVVKGRRSESKSEKEP